MRKEKDWAEMNLRRQIKKVLTLCNHPITTLALYFKGCKDFVIGKRGRINDPSLISIGNSSDVGYDCRLILIKEYMGKHYSPSIIIGNRVSIANRFTILCADKVLIEDDNLIASDVVITSHNHGINPDRENSYASEPLNTSPVAIGRGCWIGEKVIILPGVEIGERSIIGAGSIVTKSIPSYSIAVGSPAKVIKQWDKQKKTWVKV